MPIVRKIAFQTYMLYDGTNAAECLAWLNNAPGGLSSAGPVDAPNGWVIESTDADGTLNLNCPGGNGGGGLPMPWPVGFGSPRSGPYVGYPGPLDDSVLMDAPE